MKGGKIKMKTLDNVKYQESPRMESALSDEQILEEIRNVELFGRGDISRGTPVNFESKDIVTYKNKEGKYLTSCVGNLNDSTLNELFQEYGIVSREKTGKVYFLATSNSNYCMSDPTTGVSTSFQYRVFNDGNEDLFFDAIPFGNTSFNDKIKDTSLKKIVKSINPCSKLL